MRRRSVDMAAQALFECSCGFRACDIAFIVVVLFRHRVPRAGSQQPDTTQSAANSLVQSKYSLGASNISRYVSHIFRASARRRCAVEGFTRRDLLATGSSAADSVIQFADSPIALALRNVMTRVLINAELLKLWRPAVSAEALSQMARALLTCNIIFIVFCAVGMVSFNA